MVQPISSEITGLLHDGIARLVTGDKHYVHRQKHLDPRRILSKMHGETTFFVQSAILGLLVLVLQHIRILRLERNGATVTANIVVIIFAFVMATDMAWRCVRRAKRLAELASSAALDTT